MRNAGDRRHRLFVPLPRGTLALVLLLSAVSAPVAAQDPHGTHAAQPAPANGGVPLYDNLGSFHYRISTRVPRAQAYFDQGLRLTFAFNHAEAIRAFEEAARIDPDCAMCYWGIAFALGSNINLPMPGEAVAPAYGAVQRAAALAGKASDVERAPWYYFESADKPRPDTRTILARL